MLNVPINVLKDFIQIMKLELMPGLLQQQGMRWSVQWMLRVPPSALPIVPTGMSGVLAFRAKVLFFVSKFPVTNFVSNPYFFFRHENNFLNLC